MHLVSVCCILTASAQVPAYSIVVPLISEANQLSKVLSFHQQVYSLWLLVAVNEVRDDDINQFGQIVSAISLFDSLIVFYSNLPCECS